MHEMIRSCAFAAIVASSLGGCRSPSTAPNVYDMAGSDAQANPTAPGIVRRAARADPAAIIDYRGEEIGLTKRYDDFDEFKNDPNNIAPEEYDRVRKLVETTPVPEHCANREEVLKATSALEFPGYGSNGIAEPHAPDPFRLIGEAIEIPHADADRVVIYLRDDRGYRLVDDTVFPELPLIAQASVRDGKVTYLTLQGTVVAERPIRSHPGQ
jgi:hypothetical protein